MFCPNCGTQIPDGSVFCPSCGNRISAQPAAAPAAQSAPLFANMLAAMKGLIKDPVKTVADAKEEKTWYGPILIGAAVLFFALALFVNCAQMIKVPDMLGGMFEDAAPSIFSIFLMALLTAVLTAGAAFGAMLLITKKFAKKEASITGILAMLGLVSLPVTAVCIVNLLLGFIWFGIPVILFFLAAGLGLLLLFAAVNGAYFPEGGSFYPFLIVAGSMIFIFTLFALITLFGTEAGCSVIGFGTIMKFLF